tara:strand:- start:11490 stop:12173 length:684 start_codon:yes stop_codon:yes gene_type:complete
MGNINDKVKELNPHVLSIRFTNGLTVVDCAFKPNWGIPKSDVVGNETTPDKPNYYMLYPLNEKVGIDEILDYVAYIIQVNVERELKIKLLQTKITELKSFFTKNSLEKCKTIQFTFKTDLESEEEIGLNEMPIIFNEVTDEEAKIMESVKIDGDVPEIKEISQKEILQDTHNVNPSTAKFNNETFDLPPKTKEGKIVVEEFFEPEVVCKCDPNDSNQVCPVCIDSKY